MKKGEHKEIFSIRKYKAYGANSALIGLVGPAVLMGSLLSPVQAEENAPVSDSKPLDRVETSGASTSDVETNHLIVTSSQPGVHPTEEADLRGEGGTSEGLTTPKRAVSIVYKVRYVDRQRKTVVHEVTKTKTVETSEAKARATVTEIGAELANDSQLENYYVPDGNPTTMTKEIVEGEDNIFEYEVEGFGEAEATNRTVTLKYTVDYVDEKSGLVLASEDKEETLSTTEAVAKKEVTVQASLDENEALKGWSLPANVADHQTLTLVEGSVGKVTFTVQNSDTGKPRKKRKVEYRSEDGNYYLTLENYSNPGVENSAFAGRPGDIYKFKYKIGVTDHTNPENEDLSNIEMTEGAKKLGFTLDKENGWLTATVNLTREMEGAHEVGIQFKNNPNVKVVANISFSLPKRIPHHGFELISDSSGYTPSVYSTDNLSTAHLSRDTTLGGRYGIDYGDGSGNNRNKEPIKGIEKDDSSTETNIIMNRITMPSTPFGYLVDNEGKTTEDVTKDTKRYYAMIPIYAPLDVSTNYVNNNKQGLSIKDFQVLSASDGVEVKLVDLRIDKAPDKGYYSNDVDFQTMPEYDSKYGSILTPESSLYGLLNTPYYLRFTKLPKAGVYSVKFKITDSLGLEKIFTLNFKTYENSISVSPSQNGSYALTNADALFEPNEEYVDKATAKVTLPISDKEQILGKVTLNKDNAYIKADSFPAGVELRAVPGKVDAEGHPTEAYVVKTAGTKVAMGKYSFSVKAYDGHYQTGAPRTFEFEIVDAINPIPNQHWREGTVPTPIPVSMENNSKITGIRVESSGGYALFEGNTSDSNATISIYGLKSTPSQQKARVYVTFTDGNGEKHTTFTDFYYDIDPNPVADLTISVTNDNQEIFEGEEWKEMVITTTPSEGVTIKVDKTKLPKGTRLEGNKITGKGLYEGKYVIPILAIKDGVFKSTLVHLTVKEKEFVVSPETIEVPVLSEVSGLGLQNAPDDARVTYQPYNEFVAYELNNTGLRISSDGTKITGTPTKVGRYDLTATISRRGSNGLIRTTTTTYTINVTPVRPSLTISSATQPTDAYTSNVTRLKAPIGTEISPITIKHDPHSSLTVSNSLPDGLTYSYDAATHTGTITGTPSAMRYNGYVYEIPVSVELPYKYTDGLVPRNIDKTIYIEVTPITSGLTIDHENQTFAANEEMTPITVSDFDERATIDLKYAPDGVTYNRDTHQITGSPTAGVGKHRFYVRAIMPLSLGGGVTEKEIVLTVTKLEPTLTVNPPSVEVTVKEAIPPITITKDSYSLYPSYRNPYVVVEGSNYHSSLSDIGLSFDESTGKITGTPTKAGNYTIHLSTFLGESYTGVSGGVTKELDIPLTVTPLTPSLESDVSSIGVTVKEAIPPITITKDSHSTFDSYVVVEGSNYHSSLSDIGLSFDKSTGKITGTPTIVGNHTIHLSTFLDEDYTGVSGGVTKELDIPLTVTAKEFDFMDNQNRRTTVMSEITPVTVSVPDGIEVSVESGYLPPGVSYNSDKKVIEGTPTEVGTYTVTMVAKPSGTRGNEKKATVTIQVDQIPATIRITRNNQTIQVGTSMEPSIVEPNDRAEIYGSDALLDSFSGSSGNYASEQGIEESRIAAFLKIFYGLTYDANTHTISGTPTRRGTITFTFIARNDYRIGGGEARETFVLNVVDSLSKIPVITEAQEGANVIKGSGVAGATVTVTLPDGVEKTAEVATDGTWTVATTAPLVKGQSISARQKEENKTLSNDISATVIAKEGLVPSKEAGVDAIIEGATTITGKGINGSTINLTLSDGTVKTATVSEGTWSVTIDTAVVKGENIRVTQTEPNKATSPIVTATVVPKITKGDKGETGAAGANGTNGKDGFTPEVSVEETPDGSYTITVTQPEGKKPITVTVKNGTNGRDGRTPKVALTPIYENPAQPRTRRARSVDETQPTRKQIGVHITVYYDNNNNGIYDEGIDEKITEEDIYDGVDGNDGRDGRDGKDILNGTATPDETQGKDGDTFVNTATGDVFVKENGTWKSAGNIKGPKGADGKDILNGKTNPTSDTGKDGDTFVNTATGDVFVKENGIWKPAGNIKGLQGADGHDGAAGATGATGAAGRDGKDGFTPKVTVTDNPDGSHTITITQPDNQPPLTTTVRNGVNGLNGKSLVAKKDGNETKIYVEDPANPGQPLDPTKPLATILDGLKGDNGADGKSPTVTVTDNGDGTHTITVHNPDGSESTTKIKDGENGKTSTIVTTENPDGTYTITVTNPDGTSKKTIIRDGKDGKTPKVEVTDNNDGTHTVKVTDGDGNVTNIIIKDGKDGKAATATIAETNDGNHTVTITNPDGTETKFVVKNGRDGVDGRTPTASVRDNGDGSHTIVITNPEGVTTETTVYDGKSPTVSVTDEHNGTHKITVVNGDGTTTETIIKDGKSPVATVKDNKDGTYTIRVENGNGTVSETTVHDGKSPTARVVDNGDGTHTVTIVNSDGTTSTTTVRDGKSPKLEVINNNNGSYTVKVTGTDGKETSTTIFDGKSPTAKIVDNGDGTHTVTIIDSDGHSYTSTIKDGKDGKSPTATVRNNNDGTHTVTIINPDGSKTETVIKDGKDGKSPTVNVKDNGDGTHTITIVNTDGGVITTVIRDGKCGCNNQPGGSTEPKPDSPKPEGSTGPKPDSPKPEGSTGPKPDSPKPEGSTGPKPDSPKPEGSTGPKPDSPKPGGSTGPKPDSPKPGGSRFEIPEPPVHEIPEYIGVVPVEPTPVGSTPSAPTPAEPVEPTPNEPAPEMPIPSANTNPIVPTLVFENHENRLPETGTQSDYLFLLLGSGILLSLYVGRRKED